MNAADALPVMTGIAAGLTLAAAIICAKAWLALREANRRNARLRAQSAAIEADREINKRNTEALRSLLRRQPLFDSARKFEEV